MARLGFVELCYEPNGGVKKGYLQPYFLCQPLNSDTENWYPEWSLLWAQAPSSVCNTQVKQ
jgi:hypothetical protein